MIRLSDMGENRVAELVASFALVVVLLLIVRCDAVAVDEESDKARSSRTFDVYVPALFGITSTRANVVQGGEVVPFPHSFIVIETLVVFLVEAPIFVKVAQGND